MSTRQIQKLVSDIYSYNRQIQGIFAKIDKELPKANSDLIHKYDREMINTSKAKGTRRKHLQTLYILSKMLGKEWSAVTKEDIETLVSEIMEKFAKENW